MGCAQSRVVLGANGVTPADLLAAEFLFFDCDDTLYQNNWATAERLKASIDKYTVEELGLPPDEAFKLYLEHGTALRGLVKLNHLPESRIEHFLQDVHNVSLEEIGPRPELRAMILRLGHKRRFVFTASIREHAERCLERLGIADLFEDIIDCRTVNLQTKHDPMSFVMAMEAAGATDPSKCILFDDSVKNMRTAKHTGFVTCLVGKERGTGKDIVCPEADFKVDNLMDIETAMKELFVAATRRASVLDAMVPARLSVHASLEELTSSEAPAAKDRRIIIVLGGPGSGKGSQCAKIVGEFDQVRHLSAGDLLRAEMADPSSEHGKLIDACIKEGRIVPAEITMRLIINAMDASDADVFLIDGCPRDQDNLTTLEDMILDSGEARLAGVLFYDCPEEEMLNRILKRGETSGRTDDNVESAKKRFETFTQQTMPIVEQYRLKDLVYDIDATRTVDEVFEESRKVMEVLLKGSKRRASFRRSARRASVLA